MPERLFLLDAMALIYRAYFSMIRSPLTTKSGENTAAVYGFINALNKIIEDEKPDYIGVAFDTDEPTFRHKMYKEYKGTRQAMPDDLIPQISRIREVIAAYNIPIIEKHGFEADDIIGTIVKIAEKNELCSFIVTPDKDFTQLVNKSIKIYKPARSILGKQVSEIEIIDSAKVKERFGVGPERVIDILALIGDKVDNVPGVKGIGEKTAVSLLTEFGSLDELYENLDKIKKPKLKENLAIHRDDAFLSRQLVTIHCDIPLQIKFDELKRSEKNSPLLEKLYTELEFRSFLKKLKENTEQSINIQPVEVEMDFRPEKPVMDINTQPHSYYVIKNKDKLKLLVNKLYEYDEFAYDTETTSEDPLTAELCGLSFAYEENEAFYVPINYKELQNGDLFANDKAPKGNEEMPSIFIDEAIEILKPILEDRRVRKIGHNIKYDMLVLKKYGIDVNNVGFDSMVAGYILRPESQYKMDYMSEVYLNYRPIPITELIGEKKNQITMDNVPYKIAADYAAEDADVTLRLYHRLEYELKKINLIKLCTEIEFPLIEVLTDMEYYGVKVDKDFLLFMNQDLQQKEKVLESEIYEIAGLTFNINSPKQLQDILFDKLKLNPGKKTKTGFSTDIKVLEDLRFKHPIINKLLDYRVINKLRTTYTEGLLKLTNQNTGKVHTSFNQCVAATGRLSSANPNLQNIPIRTDIGRNLRKAFIPSQKENVILSADYSQIELRLMAHLSEDENMLKAFDKKRDIHTETAARIFKVKNDRVDTNMRRKAKEVNFGIIYGIQAFGLSSRLNIDQQEAREIINTYFNEFPGISRWLEEIKNFARKFGYTETLTGRRRYLSNINNKNAVIRQRDERIAINMPVQGTAADMIKIAMINIYNEMEKIKLKSKMILQVHDELIFDCVKEETEELKKIVTNKMKHSLKLKVPIEVDVGVGENWFVTHK